MLLAPGDNRDKADSVTPGVSLSLIQQHSMLKCLVQWKQGTSDNNKWMITLPNDTLQSADSTNEKRYLKYW
jgi:hypothetical protein